MSEFVYAPLRTVRVTQLCKGDKHDRSLEMVVRNSEADCFIVERSGSGFIVSTAVRKTIGASKPVVKKEKVENAKSKPKPPIKLAVPAGRSKSTGRKRKSS